MRSIQIETAIAAPKDRVFAAATDFENAPKRISSIKKVEILTPGPVRVGTKWRETRAFGKREGTEVFEVTMLNPTESGSVGGTSCGCRFSSTFRFASAGNGTRVTLEMTDEPVTLMAKIFAPLLGAMMRGVMTKCVTQDFADLKRSLEGGT